MPELLDTLETTLKRNALKYHVGHDIFCPGCGAIMDCKRAVEFDLFRGEKLVTSKILCAKCWESKAKDAWTAAVDKAAAEKPELGLRYEINDGRELFKRRKK